jgi:hypothetical protein
MGFNILMLADFRRKSANTIIDHVASFRKYSRNNFFFFDPLARNKPIWLNMNRFDIVILHYSIYILGNNYINETWRDAIASCSAVKMQFIQDEYRTINAFHERMMELGINVLFTCVPDEEIEKVYPSEKLKGLTKINNLTGYVPEYYAKRKPDFSMKHRQIDVGYRGRGYGGLFWFGELFQEKVWIGEYFLQHVKNFNLHCDISSQEKDRIYGKNWLRFMKNCKCMLGTESGASVFDFTGEIEKNVTEYCSKNPNATFSEVKELFFNDADGLIRLNQISPRAFESIGCGTCQILYEGGYSGILKPDIHYIELKKDFSNIEDVVARIRDGSFLNKLAERAYKDIVASGNYSYPSFIQFFDKKVDEYMMKFPAHLSGKRTGQAGGRVLRLYRNAKTISRFMFSRIISLIKVLYFRILFRRAHPFFTREKLRLVSFLIKK